MSIIPSADALISCNLCAFHPKDKSLVVQHILDDLRPHEGIFFGLIRGIVEGRYEVSVTLAPSFEFLQADFGVDVENPPERGQHGFVYRTYQGDGQSLYSIAPPEGAVIVWVIQLYDRAEPDERKRHSAIIYTDGEPRRIKLALNDRQRLMLNISDIGAVDSWLYRWVDYHKLFNGVNTPEKAAQAGSATPTSQVLFSRFIAACKGDHLGKVAKLGAFKQHEPLEVHHGDNRPWHNCSGNLWTLRKSIHEAITGRRLELKKVGVVTVPAGWLRRRRGATRGGVEELIHTSTEDLYSDLNIAAWHSNNVADVIQKSKRRKKGKPLGESELPVSLQRIALDSGLLPDGAAMWIKLEAATQIDIRIQNQKKDASEMTKRGGSRPGAGRPAKQPEQQRQILNARISPDAWASVKIYAEMNGRTVTEVIEEMIAVASTQPPFAEFFGKWFSENTVEDTIGHLRKP